MLVIAGAAAVTGVAGNWFVGSLQMREVAEYPKSGLRDHTDTHSLGGPTDRVLSVALMVAGDGPGEGHVLGGGLDWSRRSL